MGQALQKFELVEADASGSAIAPEECIAEPIGEPLRNQEIWLFAEELAALAGVSDRMARKAIKSRKVAIYNARLAPFYRTKEE